MKKYCIALGLTALMTGAGCRALVYEDRSECPSFLLFDVVNADQFLPSDRVHVTVYRQPENELADARTPLLRELEERTFRFELKKAEAWSGYGLLGVDRSRLTGDSKWMLEEGQQGDPLFRFHYHVPGFEETETIPVEFVKDHSRVTLKFLRFDQFEGSGGQFPFEIVIKGNTCGIDARTGLPIRGAFLHKPAETFGGTFSFILPRQGDHALTMELWAKPGLYTREGLIDSFNLSALFQQLGDIDWEAKNLPDIYLEINYIESVYHVFVQEWEDVNELNYEL